MAYVLPEDGHKAVMVDAPFVQACGVLTDMQDVYGATSPDEPIPLPTVSVEALQGLLKFYTTNDLETVSPPHLLTLVRAADYLNYEKFISAAVDRIANLICYADPEHVEELFGIEPLTLEQMENIARENPFLLEK